MGGRQRSMIRRERDISLRIAGTKIRTLSRQPKRYIKCQIKRITHQDINVKTSVYSANNKHLTS